MPRWIAPGLNRSKPWRDPDLTDWTLSAQGSAFTGSRISAAGWKPSSLHWGNVGDSPHHIGAGCASIRHQRPATCPTFTRIASPGRAERSSYELPGVLGPLDGNAAMPGGNW